MADDMLFALVADGEVLREHGGEVVAPWWSFTKTLIAAAVMRMATAGEIDLDAQVEGRVFSIRQVLRHEAGLPDYGGMAAYHQAVAAGEAPWSPLSMVERAGGPIFAAGEGWAYSNIGYLWLRELVEQRHGPNAIAELVLGPLGLTQAKLARTPGDLDGVRMGQAAGYHPGWVYHGLVVGPMREAALALDRLGGLVGKAGLTAMHEATPLPQFSRQPWRLAAYGLGMMTPQLADGSTVYGHTGGGPGSSIAVYRHGGSGRTAAVFALTGASAAVEGPAADMLQA